MAAQTEDLSTWNIAAGPSESKAALGYSVRREGREAGT